LVLKDLRGHVERRAEHGFGPALLVEDFGESKIGDLDNTVVSEDICQFEVPVDDFVFIKMMESVNKFTHNTDGLIFHQIFFVF
jgi:hypothetical protein